MSSSPFLSQLSRTSISHRLSLYLFLSRTLWNSLLSSLSSLSISHLVVSLKHSPDFLPFLSRSFSSSSLSLDSLSHRTQTTAASSSFPLRSTAANINETAAATPSSSNNLQQAINSNHSKSHRSCTTTVALSLSGKPLPLSPSLSLRLDSPVLLCFCEQKQSKTGERNGGEREGDGGKRREGAYRRGRATMVVELRWLIGEGEGVAGLLLLSLMFPAVDRRGNGGAVVAGYGGFWRW